MRTLAGLAKIIVLIVLIVIIEVVVVAALVMHGGFSARAKPTALEAFIARRVRLLAIPQSERDAKNPVPFTPEVLAEARAHFADHCAECHGNDGSGESEIGPQMYPKPPDMRKPGTQSLTDGELYYIIHNGVRFTGMPAWGSEDPHENLDHWKLVYFIRHLPQITPAEVEEMKKFNPTSPHEQEENHEGGHAEHDHHDE